uniref:Glutamine amidotransferase domain-containing protein n=1 Tax=Ananas comosus var. bracteatus TaxID=296719 RepID=A0A6V7P355_ANACO|nr:unnamed protein product [Ananas comosus var. bracteatus]
MKEGGERRYALLLAAKDSEYVTKMYDGYYNVFVQAFGTRARESARNLLWTPSFMPSFRRSGREGEWRWDVSIRKVMIMEDLLQCTSTFGALEDIPQCAMIIECHQDEVWEVPFGAKVLAYSEKTGVEMFCVGEHILGIQGHPEYTKDILYNLIDRLVSNESIGRKFSEDAKAQVEAVEPDTKFWELLCKSFLKRR